MFTNEDRYKICPYVSCFMMIYLSEQCSCIPYFALMTLNKHCNKI